MPFDTSTRLWNLVAERKNVPIRKKRSDTICIKPMLFLWCWWWDLNPHVVSNIGFWVRRVCHSTTPARIKSPNIPDDLTHQRVCPQPSHHPCGERHGAVVAEHSTTSAQFSLHNISQNAAIINRFTPLCAKNFAKYTFCSKNTPLFLARRAKMC